MSARPWSRIGAALIGLAGVTLLVLRSPDGVTALGLAGAVGSVLVSALGFVLIKRWTPPVDMITLVSWQLVGRRPRPPPRRPDRRGRPAGRRPRLPSSATRWIAIVGTGLAYVCWFTGLRAMPAGAVSLIGLINPLVGTALGVAFAHEAFGSGRRRSACCSCSAASCSASAWPGPRRHRAAARCPQHAAQRELTMAR